MRRYWAAPLALGLAALAACSSSNGPPARQNPAGQPASSGTDDASSGVAAPAGNTNPDGVAYPSPATGYGRNPRIGATPGDVMQNFKFLGFPNADPSQGLQTIALADYYDPCNKRYKLIHLTVASVWCVPCNNETDAIVAAKKQLDSMGVLVLQALDDGPTLGTGATLGDLTGWIRGHRTNFTEMLDPGLMNLSGFFNAAAVPWNCDLDPRTMEILRSGTGWAGDVMSALAPALHALPPTPGYPLPVQCN
jgi:hypothetical protein